MPRQEGGRRKGRNKQGRRALESNHQRQDEHAPIKTDADEVVDSIVAEDIGKLPDKAIGEML